MNDGLNVCAARPEVHTYSLSAPTAGLCLAGACAAPSCCAFSRPPGATRRPAGTRPRGACLRIVCLCISRVEQISGIVSERPFDGGVTTVQGAGEREVGSKVGPRYERSHLQ